MLESFVPDTQLIALWHTHFLENFFKNNSITCASSFPLESGDWKIFFHEHKKTLYAVYKQASPQPLLRHVHTPKLHKSTLTFTWYSTPDTHYSLTLRCAPKT